VKDQESDKLKTERSISKGLRAELKILSKSYCDLHKKYLKLLDEHEGWV